MMKTKKRVTQLSGAGFLLLFALWTVLILLVDVRAVGQNETNIGFSTINCWFHELTGVNMTLYTITDWLGLVPVAVGMCFAVLGLIQLIRRRSLLKVDGDILILGVYYLVVVACYLIFEAIPINYRPVLINRYLEASYPSSTTLLVACVMPTLPEQLNRRVNSIRIRRLVMLLTALFSGFMVIGRLISGVHWLTDIIGSILLSAGLFLVYRALVMKKEI